MTTFVQPSLSYSHYVIILSLPFSLSIVLTNKKREKVGCHTSCHQMVVQISLLNQFYDDCTYIIIILEDIRKYVGCVKFVRICKCIF